MLKSVLCSLIICGLLSLSTAVAETTSLTTSQPCIGTSMGLSADIESKIQKLNTAATDIKARLAGSLDDSAQAKALQQELADIQAQLLDLVFERECTRRDMTIQVLRGPGDSPPAWLEITTYFATNRKATGNTLPEGFFGADRQQDLQFGRTVVSIPTARQPGTLNLPSLWKFELTADPNKHFVFKRVVSLASDTALAEMSKVVTESSKKSLLVFVHGYNVSFADAALRTAQPLSCSPAP